MQSHSLERKPEKPSNELTFSRFTPKKMLATNGVFALSSGKIMLETEDKHKLVWDPQGHSTKKAGTQDIISKMDKFYLDKKVRQHLESKMKGYQSLYVRYVSSIAHDEIAVCYDKSIFIFVENEKGLQLKQKIKNTSWSKCVALSSHDLVIASDEHSIQCWQRPDKQSSFKLKNTFDFSKNVEPLLKNESCFMELIPLSPTTVLYSQLIHNPKNVVRHFKQCLFKIDMRNGQLLNKVELQGGKRIQQFYPLPDSQTLFCVAQNKDSSKEAIIWDTEQMAGYPLAMHIDKYYFCHSVLETGKAVFIEGINEYDFEVHGNIDVYEFPHIKKFHETVNLKWISPRVFSNLDIYFPTVLTRLIMDYLNNQIEIQLTREQRMDLGIHPEMVYAETRDSHSRHNNRNAT